MRLFGIALAGLLSGCAMQQVPPIPEPGYRWTRHICLMTYSRAGSEQLKQQVVDINLLDDSTRDGGILLASHDGPPPSIAITANNTYYRMQGALLTGGSTRLWQGRVAAAPNHLRGWLALYQHLRAGQERLPLITDFAFAPTGEKWHLHFLRVEVHDESRKITQ